jgi:glutamyl-tRNA reductase
VTTLFVANRRRERATVLADRFGGGTIAFDELPPALEEADIVVASTSSPHALIGADELAPIMATRTRPLLLIDLAVPRDIDPSCGELPGVTLANIDDLRAVVERHRHVRRAEARRAEGIVEEEIRTFAGWLGSLESLPTITALREHADRIVADVLDANATRWETDADRARGEAVARAVAKRLLHEPTIRVRQSGGEHRHARMHLLRELFGLEEAADATVAEEGGADVRELRRPA